jgi:hypothetical protein
MKKMDSKNKKEKKALQTVVLFLLDYAAILAIDEVDSLAGRCGLRSKNYVR